MGGRPIELRLLDLYKGIPPHHPAEPPAPPRAPPHRIPPRAGGVPLGPPPLATLGLVERGAGNTPAHERDRSPLSHRLVPRGLHRRAESQTQKPSLCMTCVWICVVSQLTCPRRSCGVRMSVPPANQCVPNDYPSMSGIARLWIPARSTAARRVTLRCFRLVRHGPRSTHSATGSELPSPAWARRLPRTPPAITFSAFLKNQVEAARGLTACVRWSRTSSNAAGAHRPL
jgi:hypothetical protein